MPPNTKPTSDPPLDIRLPGLAAVVSEITNLSVLDALAIRGRPVDVAELTTRLGWSHTLIQSSLDRMAEVGLVRAIRARGRHRAVRWEPARDDLNLFYREGDAKDEALRARIMDSIDLARDEDVEAHLKPLAARVPGQDAWLAAKFQSRLSRDEVNELLERIMAVVRWFDLRTRRSRAGSTEPSDPEPADCNYDVRISLAPLLAGVHPIATVKLLSSRNRPYWSEALAVEAHERLSDRERTIATGIADGRTNAELAKDLGLSANTIKTYVKRLFEKLGVSRRSQVADAVRRLP